MTESSSPANPGPDTPPAASAAKASEPAAAPAADAKPAAKPKPPAPEDQPFDRFIPDLLLPAIATECRSYGGPAPELSFRQGPMPVVGCDCWMVEGQLPGERRFWLCFTSPDIQSSKTVAWRKPEPSRVCWSPS